MHSTLMHLTSLTRVGRLAAIACFVGACDSPTDETDTSDAATTISAVVDGKAWSGAGSTAMLNGAGNFTISVPAPANSIGTGISLQLFSVVAPGTYPLGVDASVIGGSAEVYVNGSSWSTTTNSLGGTVTITEVSTARVAGTFSFTGNPGLRPQGASPSPLAVTDGKFSAAVTGSGTMLLPENIGSRIVGSLLSAPFTARTIAVAQAPSSGALVFSFRSSDARVAIEVSGLTGVGTYAVGGTTGRLMRVEQGFNVWGGTAATSSGTLTVSSVTAGRVKGTITGSLQPTFAGRGTPEALLDLSFDLGVP